MTVHLQLVRPSKKPVSSYEWCICAAGQNYSLRLPRAWHGD